MGRNPPSQNVVGLGGLARNQVGAEAFLRLELEQEESGPLGERAKLGHLADPDITVTREARQRQLKGVHEPYHEVARRVVAENQAPAGAQDSGRLGEEPLGCG